MRQPTRMNIRGVALYAGALWLAVALGGAWAWRVSWLGGTFDPVLVVVLVAGLHHGPEAGAWAGLVGGLLQDLAGGGPLGLSAMAKLLLGFGAGILARNVLVDSSLAPWVFAVAATGASRLLETGVGGVVGEPALVSVPSLVVSACYNAALASAVLAGFRRWGGRSVARAVPPARAR